MNKEVPGRIISMIKKKCPNCHIGDMYTNKSIFPLGKMMDMPERCPHCGQKYELETGFWFGTGYISYGLSVGIVIALAVLFQLVYGFSWKDNSVFIFLGIMVAILAILQPYLMRISRVIYLYIFVKYGKGTSLKNFDSETKSSHQ